MPPSIAVHYENWKLIRLFNQGKNGNHDYLLYNLAEDIGEKNNLALTNQQKVMQLDQMIENYLISANAVIPQPNPDFDPAKYHPENIGLQKSGLKIAKKVEVNR